jgi:hypothetical protein
MAFLNSHGSAVEIFPVILLWFAVLYLVIMLFRRAKKGSHSKQLKSVENRVGQNVGLEEDSEALMQEFERLSVVAHDTMKEWEKWECRMPEDDSQRHARNAAWKKYISAFDNFYAIKERLLAFKEREELRRSAATGRQSTDKTTLAPVS